ncbi:MAG: hydroxyacid dehydrogenase [Flavobacteriales bacterium]|nr:hydroxyacid dehydrogenase [Flavobacteriales bacterium]
MRVLFIDQVHEILEQRLTAHGCSCEHDHFSSYDEILEKLPAYQGVVIRSRIPVDQGFFDAASQLKFIARSGAGLENIDLAIAESRGVQVFNSPEGNRDAVGEQAIGMLLMLANHLKRADNEVRQGIWRREENRGWELAEKTVGIIGFGKMGSALAEKLQGFRCRVIAYDKYKTVEFPGVEDVSLDYLQAESDIISLHLPQSEETHHYIDAAFIEACAHPFVLINTARGKNVDTEALVEGLRNQTIAGACLDVLEYERRSFESLSAEALPEAFRYLIQAENVVLSPHVAGWTHESYVKLSTFLADKIIKAFPQP